MIRPESRRIPKKEKIRQRRLRVFRMVQEGKQRKQIARALGVTRTTVTNDINGLLRRLEAEKLSGTVVDSGAMRALRSYVRKMPSPASPRQFSDRQKKIADRRGRVFEKLLMGYGRAEIARKLGVSKQIPIHDTNVLMRLALEKTPPGVKLDPRLIDTLRDKFSDRQRKIAYRRGRVFEGLLMGSKRAKIAERLGVSKQIPIHDTNVLMRLALEKTPPGVKLDPRLIDALAISAKTTKRRAEVRKRLLAGEGQKGIRIDLGISRALVSLDAKVLRLQAEIRARTGIATDEDRRLLEVLKKRRKYGARQY